MINMFSKPLFLCLIYILFSLNSLSQTTLKYIQIPSENTLDSLEKLFIKDPNNILIDQVLVSNKFFFDNNSVQFDSTLKLLNFISTEFKSKNALAAYEYLEGKKLIRQNQYNGAHQYLLKSYYNYENERNLIGMLSSSIILSSLAAKQSVNDNYIYNKSAERIGNRVLKLAYKSKNDEYIFYALSSLHLTYSFDSTKYNLNNQTLDEMIFLTDKVYKLGKLKILCRNNLVTLYERANEHNKSFDILRSDQFPIEYYVSTFAYLAFIQKLAWSYLNTKDYEKAKSELFVIINKTKNTREFLNLRETAFQGLRLIYENEGNYKLALLYADSSFQINELILKDNHNKRIIVNKVNIKNQNSTLQKLKADSARNLKTLKIYISITLAILIYILYHIFKRYNSI
jgi:hypothetical protein